MPPVGTFEEMALGALRQALSLNLLQSIYYVRFFIKPETIEVRFRTAIAALPIVEVYSYFDGMGVSDVAPARLIGVRYPLFGGKRMDHRVEFTDLDQDTSYWIRIKVTSADATIPAPGGFVFDDFVVRTAVRDSTVWFHQIKVLKDGDPAGSATMAFTMTIYNGRSGVQLITPRFHPETGFIDISDEAGENLVQRPFGEAIELQRAPAVITPYVFAVEDDSSVFSDWLSEVVDWVTGPVGRQPPLTRPTVQTNRVEDGFEITDVFTSIALRSLPGVENVPFTLFTGLTALIYEVHGAIETSVRQTAQPFRPGLRYSLNTPIFPSSKVLAGALGRVGGKDGLIQTTIDPEGRLLIAEARDRSGSWRVLADRAALATLDVADDGSTDMVVVHSDGSLRHSRLVDGQIQRLQWRAVRAPRATDVMTWRTSRGQLRLLLVGVDGKLHLGNPQADETWLECSAPQGRVIGFVAGEEFIDCAVRADDGDLHYSRISLTDGSAGRWQSIRVREGLSAIGIARDGQSSVAPVAIDPSGILYVGDFGTMRWNAVGPADELMQRAAEGQENSRRTAG